MLFLGEHAVVVLLVQLPTLQAFELLHLCLHRAFPVSSKGVFSLSLRRRRLCTMANSFDAARSCVSLVS